MLPLAPLHPRLVHFPVALLLVGSAMALAYIIGWRRPALPALAWSMLLIGWVAIFPAVLTGLADQNQAAQDPPIVAILNPHIAVGFGLIAVYGVLLYERLRDAKALDDRRRRIVILVLLVVGMALVAVEGWLGGKLVYDLGVGVRR